MSATPTPMRSRWGSVSIIVGGVLAAALWVIFTTSHGPTSFNEDRTVLGGSMLFWGMVLGSVPNLLVAAGLVMLSSRLALTTTRPGRVGYVLLLIGLIVPALMDLGARGLNAPFFLPVAAIGLILLAVGTRDDPYISATSRRLLLSIGVLLGIAFAWATLPGPLTDPIGGYRIYGILAHFGTGIGWALFGISVLRSQAPVRHVPTRSRAT